MLPEVWLYSILSVFVVSFISLIGVLTLSVKIKKLKKIILYLVSFSAGALFGDAFFHLLPEIIEEGLFNITTSCLILGGIVLFFFMEKIVHWHHFHLPEKYHVHSYAIMNLVGDGFHNFIDGLIIGATYLVSIPVGIATTIAIMLHEIPQEIGDFGVLVHGGFSRGKALFLNFVSALLSLAGVIVSLLLGSYLENIQMIVIPIAIGGFIYVAGSDLIPELHKDFSSKKALFELLALVLGMVVMALLLLIE